MFNPGSAQAHGSWWVDAVSGQQVPRLRPQVRPRPRAADGGGRLHDQELPHPPEGGEKVSRPISARAGVKKL